MLPTLLILSVFILVTYLVRRWMRVRRYWAERGVPHEAPHPVLGSLTFLQQRNIIEWMIEKYQKFKPAPYFGMWLFWRPALVITSPELARQVLLKDGDVFRNRLVTCGKSDPIGSLNLFTVDDPLWSIVRKRTTTMFTSAKLKNHHMLNLTKSQELVQRFKADTAAKKFIHLRDVFSCFTTDVIGAAAFGVGGDATLTGESPMRVVTKQFMEVDLWRSLGFTSIFFLPEITDVFRFSFFPKEATQYFRKVYAKIYEERTKEGNSRDKDLMDALIRMKQEAVADGDERITDDVLIAQAAIFLQGGFDTTAMSLTYLIYELAYNPEVQERLYEEVLAAKREKGFTYESLQELTYLNSCIKENLRKYAAMGWLDRISSRDYKVDENLTIPKGTTIYVAAAGMHYDPEYFPDPQKFNPDRFLPENEGNIKPFTYMPFGEGPRQCIGLRFGVQSMRYVICHLVLAFQFLPAPGYPRPEDVKVDRKGVFHTPEIPLTVDFVLRDNCE